MEPHGLVQGKGTVVRVGRVHEHTVGAPPCRPPQGVQSQRPAKTLPLLVGVHGQSLEKALAGIAAGHRVGAQVACGTGAVAGRGPTSVGDGRAVERPTGSECSAVHACGGGVVPGEQSARAPVGAWCVAGRVVLEQHELLGHVKPRPLDAQRSGGGEGTGAHEAKPSAGQHGAPRLDLVSGRWALLLVHEQMRSEGLRRPRANAAHIAGAAQHQPVGR